MSFTRGKKLTIGDWINYSLLILISAACLFPFIYIISISFTAPSAYVPFSFRLIPAEWSLESYIRLLSTDTFQSSLRNTLFVTLVGTPLNIFITFTMAYGLTKKEMPGRSIILFMVIFTFVFSAGLVPNYLLVQNLGLINSHWALILPTLTNAWSLIIVKSFMDALPNDLEEQAKIDGCTDLGVFFRIIIPLSKPAIATFTLFFAVMHWNTYFSALIYLTDHSKWTLQVLVASLVIDSGGANVDAASGEGSLPSETIRMASIVLAILPILMVYPFLQKYFAKGVMLGSVKE